MTIVHVERTVTKNSIELDPLFSVEESARQLGVLSRWTIYGWLASGKLRRTRVGGRVMIRRSELQRIIRDEE